MLMWPAVRQQLGNLTLVSHSGTRLLARTYLRPWIPKQLDIFCLNKRSKLRRRKQRRRMGERVSLRYR
ncbi:hypothetical protein FOZ63_010780 [Perkinsus olseni]|uniref:Uncharacterized protein n=1 Tax=Perkinsus olseni TaxID=32597 RepID=A0A7J6U832_PEROL|nr:hypothetical protein FOZ63_010780 [Perkinsus olseni]